jgi:hypothetical protein
VTHTFLIQIDDGGTDEASKAVRDNAQALAEMALNGVEAHMKALGIKHEDIEVRYLGSN